VQTTSPPWRTEPRGNGATTGFPARIAPCQAPHQLEQRSRTVGVELGRGLVQQEQVWLESKRRCEADALQLAAGQLGHTPPRQVAGAHGVESGQRSALDLPRRRARILDAEGHLGQDGTEDDLVLRILEEGGDGAGELGRSGPPGVAAADLDAASETAAVEVRHEAGERADERRLPTARSSSEQNDFTWCYVERDAGERRPIGSAIRERQLSYRCYSHTAPATSTSDARSASLSSDRHRGDGVRVAPPRP
jgi:hypothetical protein